MPPLGYNRRTLPTLPELSSREFGLSFLGKGSQALLPILCVQQGVIDPPFQIQALLEGQEWRCVDGFLGGAQS